MVWFEALDAYIGGYIAATLLYWFVGGIMHKSWRLHEFKTERAAYAIHGFAFANAVIVLFNGF